jgi:hypothetical protein
VTPQEHFTALLAQIVKAKQVGDEKAREQAEVELANLIRGIQPPLPVDFKKAQACDAETK